MARLKDNFTIYYGAWSSEFNCISPVQYIKLILQKRIINKELNICQNLTNMLKMNM